jgi:hypothetical protein
MKCSNCASETFQCSACGSLVEPWESAVPQPVDRESLRARIMQALSDQDGHGADWDTPSWRAGAAEHYGVRADAVLAVLAGKQAGSCTLTKQKNAPTSP